MDAEPQGEHRGREQGALQGLHQCGDLFRDDPEAACGHRRISGSLLDSRSPFTTRVTRMTPVVKTMRSRSGKGEPEEIMCGTDRATANETAPRKPAMALVSRETSPGPPIERSLRGRSDTSTSGPRTSPTGGPEQRPPRRWR